MANFRSSYATSESQNREFSASRWDLFAIYLKAEALLLLIEKAKDPPGKHAAAIEGIRLRLLQAYEYERGKAKQNRATVEQWRLLIDPEAAPKARATHP